MRRDFIKKYVAWGITAFCVIVGSIVFFFALFRVQALGTLLRKTVESLKPVLIGAVIAFLLVPMFNWTQRNLLRLFAKSKHPPKNSAAFAKALSTTVCMAFALLVITLLLFLIVPQLIDSVGALLNSNLASLQFDDITARLERLLGDTFDAMPSLEDVFNDARDALFGWVKTSLLPSLTVAASGVWYTFTVAKDVLIGFIVAVYLLNSKELFAAQGKKILYSIFKIPHANMIVNNMRFIHRVFAGFINGKLLDSFIIGVLCFVLMQIIGLPYALVISVVIGITNIIPFFGPFIGAIPCSLLLLLINPWQALYFIILILALQQFDGNILGPKILGDSTGLASFWVLFSILLFGGLFGFGGMVMGVPVFAVLYSVAAGLTNHALDKKNLPTDTTQYYGLAAIDPDDKQFSYAQKEKPMAAQVRPDYVKKENEQGKGK